MIQSNPILTISSLFDIKQTGRVEVKYLVPPMAEDTGFLSIELQMEGDLDIPVLLSFLLNIKT